MTGDELAALSGVGEAAIWHATAVFLRVGPVMALVPGFSEQSVPVRIRLVLSLAMTAIVAPALPVGPPPSGLMEFAGTALAETACGLILGLGLRMFVFVLQVAGAMAAQATSLSQILGGAGAEPLPALGHVLVMGGMALAMMMGLHVRVAEFLIASYDWMPAGRAPVPPDTAAWGVAQVSRAFDLAFRLAMPFVVISVLYNLTLGVINRAMPQLMVAMVGAPVITLGGMLLLTLLSPLMLRIWFTALEGFLADPTGGVR